jgi:hypothetical protein
MIVGCVFKLFSMKWSRMLDVGFIQYIHYEICLLSNTVFGQLVHRAA